MTRGVRRSHRSLGETFAEETLIIPDGVSARSMLAMIAILIERSGGVVEFDLTDVQWSHAELCRLAIVDDLGTGKRTVRVTDS